METLKINENEKEIISKEMEKIKKTSQPLTKEERKFASDLLYTYYNKGKKINAWRYKIEIILGQIRRIENREMEYSSLYKSPTFGERVQTTKGNGSVVEMALLLEEKDKQRRIENLFEEIKFIRNEIEQMEQLTAIIDYFINLLDELDLRIIEMKFRDRKSETSIGYEIGFDQSSINKRIRKVMERVYRWHVTSNMDY